MNSTVPDDSGLSTRAARAKDVDSSDGAPSNRGTGCDDSGFIWECGYEVVQEREVVCVGVIRIEPRVVCQTD